MEKVLITGGSGLLGTTLTALLQNKNYEVRHLGRSSKSNSTIKSYVWNINTKEIEQEALEWADVVVHLAGAGIADKRWTEKRKKVLSESRVKSAELLIDAISACKNPPQKIISASGISYYGLVTEEKIMKENDLAGNDFIAKLCVDWETPIVESTLDYTVLRIGIVLSAHGGALQKMTASPLLSPLGSGKQYMPWIHIDDLCHLIFYSIENPTFSNSIVNAVAPTHETNGSFTKKLANATRKVFLPIPVPGFLLKLGLGEMANLLLEGSRISAKTAIEKGFEFHFNRLEEALKEIYQK